jgi:hypothetical protein
MISAVSSTSVAPDMPAQSSQPSAATSSSEATLKPDTVNLSPKGLQAAGDKDADGDAS